MGSGRAAFVYLQHLRLPFQLTLAPLFLFGWYLADGRMSRESVVGFVSLHMFLYPGVTAFNSAYDRDTGPVTGMLHPPEVPAGLLVFSIAVQLLGAVLAAWIGPSFLAIYGAIAVLAAAYSHPKVRLKARPWASTLVVGFGQGALGFLAGWCAVTGNLLQAGTVVAIAGAAAATLTTVGLYPSTQVFQIEEDVGRGDRTLAAALGAAPALRLGSLCLVAAAALATWLIAQRSGLAEATLIAAVYLAVVIHNEVVAARLSGEDRPIVETYALSRRTGLIATAGFLLFILCQIAADWF